MMAFVMVKVEAGKERAVMDELHSIKKVHDVYALFGEFDYIIRVETSDAYSLGQLVSDCIRKLPGIQKTTTLLVTALGKA